MRLHQPETTTAAATRRNEVLRRRLPKLIVLFPRYKIVKKEGVGVQGPPQTQRLSKIRKNVQRCRADGGSGGEGVEGGKEEKSAPSQFLAD